MQKPCQRCGPPVCPRRGRPSVCCLGLLPEMGQTGPGQGSQGSLRRKEATEVIDINKNAVKGELPDEAFALIDWTRLARYRQEAVLAQSHKPEPLHGATTPQGRNAHTRAAATTGRSARRSGRKPPESRRNETAT